MGKYFSNAAYAAMAKAEKARRSSESFFSSKSDNDNFFGNVKGQSLKVVGLEPVDADKERGIAAYNVVKFDDGHQLSTGRFFAAKGLRWPVGGNIAKLNYLASALENEVDIVVTPQDIKVEPMKRRDGTYVGQRGADGKTAVIQSKDLEKAQKDGTVINAVTYIFEEQSLPDVELVNFD